MSLCYDTEKWIIISLASVALSLSVGLLMHVVYGYTGQNMSIGVFNRIMELEPLCVIDTIGVGDDQQPKATVIIKGEYLCKEYVNYVLVTNNDPSGLTNATVVSQDSNQVVIDVYKDPVALKESIAITKLKQQGIDTSQCEIEKSCQYKK